MKNNLLIFAIGALCAAAPVFAQDAAVEERLNKLTGQLEDMQAARVKLEKQMGELTREISSLREQLAKPNGNYAGQEDLRKLAEKVQEIDQKRVADNEKILKELERIARVGTSPRPIKVNTDPPDRPAGGAAGDKWFEHVIQNGDTLSTIAMAYREKGVKVSTDQILKANPGLKPNSLKVGQKIYVPAP